MVMIEQKPLYPAVMAILGTVAMISLAVCGSILFLRLIFEA